MNRDGVAGKAVVLAKSKGMYITKDGVPVGVKGKTLSANIYRGYKRIAVSVGSGKSAGFKLSCLQAYQKYGDAVFGKNIVVRHLDGNSENDSWDNIAIGTQSENMMDKSKEERIKSAKIAASHLRKFTNQQIRDIRKRKEEGFFLSAIGREFGIGKGHVSDIVNRKLYSDVV